MNAIATELVWTLGRTTLWLALAGVVTGGILTLVRANWPAAHRIGWTLVLLVGWAVARVGVVVPWYEAPPAADNLAVVSLPESAPPDLTPADPPLLDRRVTNPIQAAMPANTPFQAAPIIIWHDWPLVVAGLWLGGMTLLAASWLIGYARFVWSLPEGRQVEGNWQDEWDALLAASGVRRAIPLRVTEDLGPMLCRLSGGYELLLPEGLWRDLDDGQRRAILRHELAHFVRGDVWKSLAVRVLALPHWFNPVAWYAVRRFDEAAEWACDAAATRDLPATTYAKALLRLGASDNPDFVYGSSARGHVLAARIRRMLKDTPKEDSTMKKIVVMTAGLSLAAMALVRIELVAQEPASVDEPAAADPSEPRDYTFYVAAGKADKTVEVARKAFEAHQAAYDAEMAPLESLYEWSLRWMQAAQSAAKDGDERLAAVREHLKRMRQLQERIKKMHAVGTRGGEEKEMSAANFYVADAERLMAQAANGTLVVDVKDVTRKGKNVATLAGADALARAREVEAQRAQIAEQFGAISRSLENKRLDAEERKKLEAERLKLQAEMESLNKATAAPALYPPPTPAVPPTPKPSRITEADILDLQIKIVELEGQLKQTDIQRQAAYFASRELRKLGGNVPSSKVREAELDMAKLSTQIETLQAEVKLYKQRLEHYEKAASIPAPVTLTYEPPQTYQNAPNIITYAATSPAAYKHKHSLRYAGKNFDEWAEELRTDLSPERRKDAVAALTAFGVKGEGRRAAEAILAAMSDVSQRQRGDSSIAALFSSAVKAFHWIPTADATPVAVRALKSESANQRAFACFALDESPDARPAVLQMLKDPDLLVRRSAAYNLMRTADTPEALEIVREALDSENPDDLKWALSTIDGARDIKWLAPLAARLMALKEYRYSDIAIGANRALGRLRASPGSE